MRLILFAIAGFLLAGLIGCANDPGSLSKSEIEAKLMGTLNLKEISLDELPDLNYSGTGVSNDGTKFTITVRQQKDEQSMSYAVMDEKGQLVSAGSFKEFGPSWLRPLDQFRKGTKLALILMVVVIGSVVVALALVRRLGNKSSH